MLFFAARRKSASIDPLAAQNPPGSRHTYRWQDVQELLRNGISVLSSVNLLHVEEYKEKVQAITGKNTTETIPKSFLLAADDIVIVDVPPDLCLWRQGEKLTSTGISNSQERQLSELRELALLLTAEVVDAQLEILCSCARNRACLRDPRTFSRLYDATFQCFGND